MAKLRWSRQAAADLEEICEYISRDSEQYARLFAQRVMQILKAMAKEKLPGSMVPEYNREEIRERLLHNHRIVVRVQKKQRSLEVVRIFHGARLLPPLNE
jgi:plasmid stabilization system protein ParE